MAGYYFMRFFEGPLYYIASVADAIKCANLYSVFNFLNVRLIYS